MFFEIKVVSIQLKRCPSLRGYLFKEILGQSDITNISFESQIVCNIIAKFKHILV